MLQPSLPVYSHVIHGALTGARALQTRHANIAEPTATSEGSPQAYLQNEFADKAKRRVTCDVDRVVR
jgi:hypothetical protein